MVDERVGIAVILIISLGFGVVASRLGLFEPDSRTWHSCLYWAVWGVVLELTLDLLDIRSDAPTLLLLVLVGAVGGGLSGLLISFVQRRFPD